METILWTHHRTGSSTFIDRTPGNKKYYSSQELFGFQPGNPLRLERKFSEGRSTSDIPAYKKEVFGNYTFKIMGNQDIIEHAKYVIDNNIECNHVLLFRKNLHRVILSHEFARITDIWEPGEQIYTDNVIEEKLNQSNRNIWKHVEWIKENLSDLDSAYQILIAGGKKVRIIEYSDIYTEHQTTGKFYHQLD